MSLIVIFGFFSAGSWQMQRGESTKLWRRKFSQSCPSLWQAAYRVTVCPLRPDTLAVTSLHLWHHLLHPHHHSGAALPQVLNTHISTYSLVTAVVLIMPFSCQAITVYMWSVLLKSSFSKILLIRVPSLEKIKSVTQQITWHFIDYSLNISFLHYQIIIHKSLQKLTYDEQLNILCLQLCYCRDTDTSV